jgi:hypothetical protein
MHGVEQRCSIHQQVQHKKWRVITLQQWQVPLEDGGVEQKASAGPGKTTRSGWSRNKYPSCRPITASAVGGVLRLNTPCGVTLLADELGPVGRA